MVVVAVLLIGLLVNQVFYALNAAEDQERALNEKVGIALGVIVDKVSANQQVCKSVDKCLNKDKMQMCCKHLNGEKEWQTIDSIIKGELSRFNIELKYNFDFVKQQPENKNTYALNMDQVFSEAGVVMYLEFPDRSKYLLKQMGPVFISSILLIFFITIAFVLMYRYYRQEQQMVTRTRDFINNMTHEFKTPLANISFASSMINRENQNLNSEKISRYTDIILAENQRLVDNCEDLLVIGMAESELKNILNEKVDVNEVTNTVVDRYFKLSLSNLKLVSNLNANPSCVLGKLSMLDNIITNLIDNAIKYSDAPADIAVETANLGNRVLIRVKDHGKGISQEAQKQIFEKFYRVDNQDQHDVKGFGLGLAYVKMVVEQMNGSIQVESKVGKGSTFIINLPVNDR